MSRRIFFFVLATSAALIASPALADRECFENSCRLPSAVEAPPQPEPAQEPQASAAPDVQPELAAVPRKLLPPVVQAKAQPVAPSPVAVVEERDGGEATRSAVTRVAPGYARAERVAGYGMSHDAAPGGAAAVEVPGAVYSPAPAPFYPYAEPDGAWRSCQSEQQRGVVYCGPTSYHPYGAYGYRPNGTYAAYRSPPIYAVAPDAKIITIEPND